MCASVLVVSCMGGERERERRALLLYLEDDF